MAFPGGAPAHRQVFLAELRKYFGTPYVFGGKYPGGLDCSGYLTWSAQQIGVNLGDPLMTPADGLKLYCMFIEDDADLRPGDLLLFKQTYTQDNGTPFPPTYATHCGVSLGAGTGAMFDSHLSDRDGVGQTDITTNYWLTHRLPGFWRPRTFIQDGEAETDELRAALVNLVGYLTGNVATALQDGLAGALREDPSPLPARQDAYSALQAAINTLRNSGPVPAGVTVHDLITLVGYLTGDVAAALQSALDGARASDPTPPGPRQDAYAAVQAATNTLRQANR
jgi:hypothetical protein